MPTVREQILARLVVLLSGATPAGSNVYRSRENAITRGLTPAIVVMPGEASASAQSQAMDRHEFTADLEVFVRGDPWDALADPVADAAHRLIRGDATLRALCGDVRFVSSSWEGQEADRTAGVLTQRYRFTYLAAADNLSAVANS